MTEKIHIEIDPIRSAQQLRLSRFGLSVITYLVAVLATYLITGIGVGDLNGYQWSVLIGISIFSVLFYSNRNLLFFVPPFSFRMLSLTLRQFLGVVATVLGIYASLFVWEITQNIPGYNLQYQIFLFGLLSFMLVWFAFFGGFISKLRRRLRFQKKETKKALEEIKIEIEEHKRTQIDKDNLIIELKEALSEVSNLSGLLPICASCKNIRDNLLGSSQILKCCTFEANSLNRYFKAIQSLSLETILGH